MTISWDSETQARAEGFAEDLFGSCLAVLELACMELGSRLGLYRALSAGPAWTPAALAEATGTHERYVREWLEQQAAAGVLDVDVPTGLVSDESPDSRRFTLSPAHAHVLLDRDSELYVGFASACVPWVSRALELMEVEFGAGRGVDFGAFGLHDLQAAMTRPVFVNHLVQQWLPALPDVQARLDAGDRLRVAEVGSGEGLAAITLALAYPRAEVDGYDVDEASVLVAREAAVLAGVADRVRFHLEDAAEVEGTGWADLALAIEMVHDVPDPVRVLRSMGRLAGQDGAVLVVDEATAEGFTAPADPMERMFYAFSTLHCLAVSMQAHGAGTGTVMRSSTLRGYAEAAGFTSVEVLPVEHPQFRLYRLR